MYHLDNLVQYNQNNLVSFFFTFARHSFSIGRILTHSDTVLNDIWTPHLHHVAVLD